MGTRKIHRRLSSPGLSSPQDARTVRFLLQVLLTGMESAPEALTKTSSQGCSNPYAPGKPAQHVGWGGGKGLGVQRRLP